MRKVKAILHIFSQSFIPGAVYYKKLLHSSFLFSVRYFLVFACVTAFASAGILFTTYASPSNTQAFVKSILAPLQSFPPDTQITVTSHGLEINKDMPIFMWTQWGSKPNLLFEANKTAVPISPGPNPNLFLGEYALIYHVGPIQARVPYTEQAYIITTSSMSALANLVNSMTGPARAMFYVLLFTLFPLGFVVWYGIQIVCIATLVFVLFHLFIRRVHWKKCVQAGLHGTHFPIFMSVILCLMFPNSASIFYITPVVMLIFQLVAVYEMYVDTP